MGILQTVTFDKMMTKIHNQVSFMLDVYNNTMVESSLSLICRHFIVLTKNLYPS